MLLGLTFGPNTPCRITGVNVYIWVHVRLGGYWSFANRCWHFVWTWFVFFYELYDIQKSCIGPRGSDCFCHTLYLIKLAWRLSLVWDGCRSRKKRCDPDVSLEPPRKPSGRRDGAHSEQRKTAANKCLWVREGKPPSQCHRKVKGVVISFQQTWQELPVPFHRTSVPKVERKLPQIKGRTT